ncbi:MAG: polysaccharide export protein, partial [Bacteroidaceae bacterium]|nr:polysaccharide export protein [Bacteroidaceae bacterium]
MIYLQGSEDLVNMPQRIADTYAIRLKPNDIVYVTVTGYNEELMKPFKNSQMLGTTTSSGQQGAGFLIDPQGYVTIPYVGKILASGKTTSQLSEDIRKRLIAEDYMKEPNVTVRMADYKISVMGEVKNPGQKTITGERVTILEALSMAGDLPETARRDSILVVRED